MRVRRRKSELNPTLTTGTADHEQVTGQGEIVNGPIKVRLTHPSLYRILMLYVVTFLALAANFTFIKTTFLVYGQSNRVWAACFLVLACSLFCSTNIIHSLRLMRFTMVMIAVYLMFFTIGASEPYLNGVGSLQLPILYLTVSGHMFLLVYEPFINPWSAKR